MSLDFSTGLALINDIPVAVSDLLTCTRASTGYAENAGGALVLFAANEFRITDKGLLIEDQRTNYFLNSFTPVTQTII